MSERYNPPERIYLQVGGETEAEMPSDLDGVTWCSDRVFPQDVEFVRADEYEAMRERAEAAEQIAHERLTKKAYWESRAYEAEGGTKGNSAGEPGMSENRQRIDRPWSEYPVGTKAHDVMGGHWEKQQSGSWKWACPGGGSFPTPGGTAVSVTLPQEGQG